jgi:uncharacterized protein YaaN involved in tellurite resistance
MILPIATKLSSNASLAQLAQSLDTHSMSSILEFGKEVAGQTALYTDRVLAAAKLSDLAETGEKLQEIVVAAQQFDLDQIENPTAKTPFIGGLLRKFSLSKERSAGRFESVKNQVDKLVAHVDGTAEVLARRNVEYQQMYANVQLEHELLGRHVQAIELRLPDLVKEMAELQHGPQDVETTEKISMLESCQNALSKRADDLKMLQHSALQMLPMVRIIQSNNLSLVDKFQTIRQLTLPAWKRTFMLALALDEQKNAVQLATKIDDATNQILRRNAELLHQNSVATAKANQRLVIDAETLRVVHEKILLTFKDVRDIHQTGAAERQKAIADLDRLRTEMTQSLRENGLAQVA